MIYIYNIYIQTDGTFWISSQSATKNDRTIDFMNDLYPVLRLSRNAEEQLSQHNVHKVM